MRLRAARLAGLAALLVFIALASTAAAATASVEISGFVFSPASVTINGGDTVTWTNRDQAAHSAVFDGGRQTAVLLNGQSGSLTFATAGTFNYICGIHGASMSGSVIVRAAATPPPTQPPTAPPPTLAPTPVPTSRPTVAPTIAPTIAPTVEPTPTASPSPTVTPSAAATSAAPTAAPSVAVAAPTEQAPAPSAANDSGPSPLVIGGAVIALIAVAAAALTRIRR